MTIDDIDFENMRLPRPAGQSARAFYAEVKEVWHNNPEARAYTTPLKAHGEFMDDIVLELIAPWQWKESA